MSYAKLFSSIVHSTVWREAMHVKIVWITMIALANRKGEVAASIPGLADAAKVSLEQCEEALQRLSAPDHYSRTKDYEGRRITDVDGGWLLLNYEKHRDLRDEEENRIKVRERVRRHRAKRNDPSYSNASSRRVTTPAPAPAPAPTPDTDGRTDGPSVHRGADTPTSIQIQTEVLNERRSLEAALFVRVRSLQEAAPGTQWADWSAVQWMREVTSYKRRDGAGKTRGVEDPALLRTLDAIEKSIADADWWLEKIAKENADG